MRIYSVVMSLVSASCAHGSAEAPRTTPEQQARMKERAGEEHERAPVGVRVSGRHGPHACYERWVYESEEKFEKCLFNWRNTEQQRAAGNSRRQHFMRAAEAMAPQRLICADRTLSDTCTNDNWHQGCCSSHAGILRDAFGNPQFATGN